MGKNELQSAIRKMFLVQKELQAAFPKKPFTPDGRMIGDIGEAIAEIDYYATMDSKLRKHWDGVWENDDMKHREIQVKATQKDETYLKKPPCEGSLLVFKIFPAGNWEACYNGNISRVWNYLSKQKLDNTGAKIIALDILRDLNKEVSTEERILLRRE